MECKIFRRLSAYKSRERGYSGGRSGRREKGRLDYLLTAVVTKWIRFSFLCFYCFLK